MAPGTRILIICINYAPERTGIGRYTGELGDWLASQGADVQVVTGFPYYPAWKLESGYRMKWFHGEHLNGVTLLRCPLYIPKNPTPFKRILQDLSFMFTALIGLSGKLIRGTRFDHIWVASPSFLSGWVGIWAGCFNPRARRHLHVFDLPIDAAQALGMIRGSLMLRFLSLMESAMMKRYHRVSTLSGGMRKRIIQKGVPETSIVLLPIWVDTNRFQPKHPNVELLSRLGISADKRIVLYSGAVGEKQGLESLLAMAGMAQSAGMSDLLFIIAGDGPYVRTLKLMARQSDLANIMFIPLLNDDDFPDMLQSAWLHLVLQRDVSGEHFMPSKLYPILAAGGLAMVTADPLSSLGGMLADHQIAQLVSDNEPTALFQHLVDLLQSPEKGRAFKLNARQYAVENLSRAELLSSYWNSSDI